MNHLVLFVLSVSAMAFTSNACQFGSEAIQTVYDRFELFRKTKAFDPADSKIPLEQYQFYNNDGEKRLAVKIDGVYMVEYYTTDDTDNKLQTKNGQYHVKDGVILNYKRDENGEFSFDDWSNQKKFKSSLRSIDAELPSDFEEDYKQVLVDLNAMRKKMFDYQNGLSKEDFERVQLFEFTPFSSGDGFYAQYIESDGGSLTVSKENGSDNISGRLSCDYKDQKYNIVDGKVVADGEPFVPVYH
ncbi:uncharacterized protein LOC119071796 [Bradysia coprophila]|uniref:uncharacterized protein LOC119071796 n=1 Tax=Bradysia coprophila TaxID=38358 RepID=UPI00187DB3D0|nr:uncharacterized protein LOC119071796 [Bradysia coprophila]XP_037032757.1 uncharacterized protein LOC119071796 [Bradysia coprophila]